MQAMILLDEKGTDLALQFHDLSGLPDGGGAGLSPVAARRQAMVEAFARSLLETGVIPSSTCK
jgi:hypothetical protein